MSLLKRDKPPRWVECTNQLCRSRDYIATQPVRRGTSDGEKINATVVGALHQCCKCGELYYATPEGCYRAPNQFQVREPKSFPDLRPQPDLDAPEIDPLPEP